LEIAKETCRISFKTLRFSSYTRPRSEKNVVDYNPLLAILPQESDGVQEQPYLAEREHVVVTMLSRKSGEWPSTRLDIRLTRVHGYPKPTTHLPLTSYVIRNQCRVRSQHTWFTDLTECMPMLSWKRGMQVSYNLPGPQPLFHIIVIVWQLRIGSAFEKTKHNLSHKHTHPFSLELQFAMARILVPAQHLKPV
jgi:hypothetical protein